MGVFDNATFQQDTNGNIFQVNHLEEPFRPQAGHSAALAAEAAPGMASGAVTPRDLADEYLQEAIPHFNLSPTLLAAADVGMGDPDEQIQFHEEKSIRGNSTVSYIQTVAGIPVWESGFVVQVEEDPMQVIGAQSTIQQSLQVDMPPQDAPYGESNLDPDSLVELIGFCQGSRIDIDHQEPFIYRFSAQRRFDTPHEDPVDGGHELLPLPPVADEIEDGASYVVTAVQFTCTSRQGSHEGWLALIEARTGSVLFVRSLAGCGIHAALSLGGTAAEEVADASPPIVDAVGNPSVVFFDIGDTLGTPVFTPAGDLSEIVVSPTVLEVLEELSEKNIRIGIISDPGPLSTDLINFLLQDAGVFEYVDLELVHYGSKNSTDIFLDAAAAAGVSAQECVFVGESLSERIVASDAGFLAVAAPVDVVGVFDTDAALAWVYLTDPQTKLGSAAPPPTASTSALNRLRDLVTLRGLTSTGASQELRGEYVAIENVDPPNPSIPTSPTRDFRFSVTTNDFGAVNAYHNCDRLFRILEDFDIDVGSYFDGTNFPVPVDHRVQYGFPPTANSVNASAPGRRFPTPRSDGFRFALAARNTTVNMAAAWRVVLHEFGHACLWDHVGSANFRFAHSFGDGAAAILNDPESRAPRNRTFPWVQIGRSHMRPVTDFAWYGTRYEPFISTGNDRAGYVAEQMLSSTLFRIYQAAGGDSANRQEQEFAARYVTFLVFKAVGLMSTVNNPEQPEGFADLMMQADTGTFRYKRDPVRIGVLRKVIRWGFELQGAYRLPPGVGETPTNQIGNPPQVDVFINDGRDGHYFFSDVTDSVDIWNRRAADGGTVHQEPVVGQENLAFARISNRGLSAATNVAVEALQSPLASAQVWPDDWQPLATPVLQSPDSVQPGGDVVVGPFSWFPASTAPTLLMSVAATGDSSNLRRFTAANPIAAERVALLDNNVGMRTMTTA